MLHTLGGVTRPRWCCEGEKKVPQTREQTAMVPSFITEEELFVSGVAGEGISDWLIALSLSLFTLSNIDMKHGRGSKRTKCKIRLVRIQTKSGNACGAVPVSDL